MMNVIETRKLTKSYGRQEALRGVDLTVKQGEVYGFIGPNGAGKSTTIRIFLGMLRKSGGEAKLLGGDPWQDAVTLHQRLVYVPGDVTLWPNLTGGEVIDFLVGLHGKINPSRRKELLDRFQLDPKKKCRSYSKGNRQKVALVSAFAADAELLILDEPSSGLDPLMEQVFQPPYRFFARAYCSVKHRRRHPVAGPAASFHSSYDRSGAYDDSAYPHGGSIWKK